MTKNKNFIAIHIIPTGIGANIGGYAGDAGPANQLIASSVDLLIANPNIVNAATLHNIPQNLLYTEGYTLDNFCKGNIALRPKRSNKIGVVFDKSIPEEVLNININAINACKSVYGLDIIGYTRTKEHVGISFDLTDNNFSTGNIDNTNTLLEASAFLIDNGADALAIVCMFNDLDDNDNYSKGLGVDPVGGIESIISHLVSQTFNVPCAHAPAFDYKECMPSTNIVDPRAASEYFSPTFLPCVLAGLNKAPQIINIIESKLSDIQFVDTDIIITPSDCLGSIPVICAVEKNIQILSIKENTSVLNVTKEKLNITDKVIEASNYLEACGFIMALKQGISPATVLRPIQKTIGI